MRRERDSEREREKVVPCVTKSWVSIAVACPGNRQKARLRMSQPAVAALGPSSEVSPVKRQLQSARPKGFRGRLARVGGRSGGAVSVSPEPPSPGITSSPHSARPSVIGVISTFHPKTCLTHLSPLSGNPSLAPRAPVFPRHPGSSESPPLFATPTARRVAVQECAARGVQEPLHPIPAPPAPTSSLPNSPHLPIRHHCPPPSGIV